MAYVGMLGSCVIMVQTYSPHFAGIMEEPLQVFIFRIVSYPESIFMYNSEYQVFRFHS